MLLCSLAVQIPLMRAETVFDEDVTVRLDNGRTVRMLNRYTYNSTVAQDGVDNWIVLFCVDWWEPCASVWDAYRSMSVQWEKGLNASSFLNSGVRFAEVDCATDKALCNEQGVLEYPWAVHVHRGKFSSFWEWGDSGGKTLAEDLGKWVSKELIAATNTSDVELPPNLKEDLVGLLSQKQDRWVTHCSVGVLCIFFSIIVWILGSGFELWSALAHPKNSLTTECFVRAPMDSLLRPVVKRSIDL